MSEKQALIVEDAANWATQHQLALSELGFKTMVANDYAEASGLLRREQFAIAVIDLCLITHAEPENLNGIFLLQALAEKNIPVIIVTGHGPRKLVDRIYDDFGVFEVLDKLAFKPEKFKEYVLQATSARQPDNGAAAKKKFVSLKKIEAFIEEFVKGISAHPEKRETPIAENKTASDQAKTHHLKVFISHSAKDKTLADRLARDLRVAGVEVWYDSDEINVGDTIVEKIAQGARCDFMILLLSPEAVASWMVKQEIAMFLHEEKRRSHAVILPAFYKDCDIPPLLESRRYADFRENYDLGFAELQRSLGIRKF